MHLECGLAESGRQLPAKGLNFDTVRWILVGESAKHRRKHCASRNDTLCRQTLQNLAHTGKGVPLSD